ncbi:hypothetical protein SAMN04487905_103402 [Actinopolyspora xinjiangensis]|uniref:Uncharacterized protein n=1 Tax=Actinopolyspora xinjiangensis TaxID=405564 RepID=A0A1H0S697_9ACTN|nr:hypothetical protein SAMN04487905_103402 [Actinopolyspora xinjiangensis]
MTLRSDNVFGDDGGASQLATVPGDVRNGYRVSLAVGVDTTTDLGGGGQPSGDGGQPPSGGQPPDGEDSVRPSGAPPSS